MTGFGLTFTSYFRSQSLCTISHEPVGNNLLNAFFTSERQNRYTLRSFQNICEALTYLSDKISLDLVQIRVYVVFKTHVSAYMKRVDFIITSNKHTLSLYLTSKDSLI